MHCVRAESRDTAPAPRPWRLSFNSGPYQYLAAFAAIALATVVNFVLHPFTGNYAVSLVYLLTVVLLALGVGRGP